MTQYTIRFLTNDEREISAVANWIYNEWGHLIKGRTLETAHEKVRQSLSGADMPTTIICFIGEKPVGTAGIDTADMGTHPELTPWMVSVYVEPEYRKRGIGSALCKRIAEEFNRRGIETAYLFTPDQEKLYERLGWKVFLREEYRGEQVSIMRLDVKEAVK